MSESQPCCKPKLYGHWFGILRIVGDRKEMWSFKTPIALSKVNFALSEGERMVIVMRCNGKGKEYHHCAYYGQAMRYWDWVRNFKGKPSFYNTYNIKGIITYTKEKIIKLRMYWLRGTMLVNLPQLLIQDIVLVL